MTRKSLIQVLVLGTFIVPFTHAYAQGSLTPPAAPAPMMKTLDQVEARTPISTPTNITQSGTYYLTTNITVSGGHGIVIDADEVALDLNGFTIHSTAPSATGAGVFLEEFRQDISIVNGFITGGVTNDGSGTFSGPGFNHGIYAFSAYSVRVSNISVRNVSHFGIHLDGQTTIAEGCHAHNVGVTGILVLTVRRSTASSCGGTGIFGRQVSDSRGAAYRYAGIVAGTVQNSRGAVVGTAGDSYGIVAITASNCEGYGGGDSGTTYGISADTVQNCYGYCENSGYFPAYGIAANSVQGSYGYCEGAGDHAGYGIAAYTADNCRAYSARDNPESRGIFADGPVNTCYAYCAAGTALEAESASNCRGESVDGYGIDVERSAINCVGISSASYGVVAQNAMNCDGEGTRGISVTTATGCRGTGTTEAGINATATALNCYGYSDSGSGLFAHNAQNCYGYTTSGSYGLYAYSTAIGSYGRNLGSGTGIHGQILNSCDGISASGTSISINNNYNMP